MKTSKFTDEQITMALRQAEGGTPLGDICRRLGVSDQTFCRWKKPFLDRTILQEALREKM